ncbi:MAG: hypothetical protein WKG00_25995, partial [Polyangiaceae bacterium]
MTTRLSQLRLSLPLSLSIVALALGSMGAACTKLEEIGSDPPGSGNSGSAQGSGGSGGGGAAGAEGGAGQGGGGSGATGNGGATCHGDTAAWDAATQVPIACTKNSDCCVVNNFCISEAQVVHADTQAAAKEAWPYCDNDCNDCITPDVVVFCQDEVC